MGASAVGTERARGSGNLQCVLRTAARCHAGTDTGLIGSVGAQAGRVGRRAAGGSDAAQDTSLLEIVLAYRWAQDGHRITYTAAGQAGKNGGGVRLSQDWCDKGNGGSEDGSGSHPVDYEVENHFLEGWRYSMEQIVVRCWEVLLSFVSDR